MAATFEEALELAREKYPYPINHYEEYRDYFVFEYDDGTEHDGGPTSPIVIRKSDMAALNYAPIFFNMDVNAEDVGDVLAEGYFEIEGASHLCGGLCHESDSESVEMAALSDLDKMIAEASPEEQMAYARLFAQANSEANRIAEESRQ